MYEGEWMVWCDTIYGGLNRDLPPGYKPDLE